MAITPEPLRKGDIMSNTILTKSKIDPETKEALREIELVKPNVLQVEDLASLVELMGEEAILNMALAQLTIGFRSHIRTKLESETDGEYTFSDDDILQLDFTDWKPEGRTRISAEEKALNLLKGLDPEKAAAAIEAFEALKKAQAEEMEGEGTDPA